MAYRPLKYCHYVGNHSNDIIMAEFVATLDTINALAEQSNDFVWRLKSNAGNTMNYNPYHNERIIVNFSVWQDVDDLRNLDFKSAHTAVMKEEMV